VLLPRPLRTALLAGRALRPRRRSEVTARLPAPRPMAPTGPMLRRRQRGPPARRRRRPRTSALSTPTRLRERRLLAAVFGCWSKHFLLPVAHVVGVSSAFFRFQFFLEQSSITTNK
jgi:hypothetical protein